LQIYIPRLQTKYGEVMKLRTFAIVSVGLESILWKMADETKKMDFGLRQNDWIILASYWT